MTPEFLVALRGVFLNGLKQEFVTTAKVLVAIPDDNHDYKPDPKSKTAMELAWHTAVVDVWFLDSIAAHNFPTGGDMTMPAEMKPSATDNGGPVMPRSKSRPMVSSSASPGRSRWLMPGGSEHAAVSDVCSQPDV